MIDSAKLFPLSAVRLSPGVLKTKQDTDQKYLLEVLDVERMLAPFYRQAGIDSGEPYGGWERKDIAGHSGGHYLSALAACYAATGDCGALARVSAFVDGIGRCQLAHGDGYAGAVDKRCFEDLRRGRIEAHNFALNDIWVPLYNLHKLLAGLYDAWELCGNHQALVIMTGVAGYLNHVWENIPPADAQKILVCEHGGIAESLIKLSLATGDQRFLELADRAFSQTAALAPLHAEHDELDGLHGNTLIPKVIALAARYEAIGDGADRRAAEFFFDRVTQIRSFANGGHGESEHFFTPGTDKEHLTPYTAETCNSYNMIKLAEHIWSWRKDAHVMDYAERVLLNHVAANIGRKPGEFGYFLALAPVAVKVFSAPLDAFWCCVGTGMESPMRYAKTFYGHDGDTLYVNQYFASGLDWADKAVKIMIDGKFPVSGKIRLTVHCRKDIRFVLKLRKPAWSRGNFGTVGCDGYVTVERMWHDGEVLELDLGMDYYSEVLPDSDYQAFFYGPTLMAGALPTLPDPVDDPAKERFGDHLKARGKTDEIPPLLVSETILSDPRAANPALLWMPLYDVYEEHYGVYFRVVTPRMAKRCQEEMQLAAEAEQRLHAATCDTVTPGFQQSEVEHEMTAGGTQVGDFLHAKHRLLIPGGDLGYQLKTDPVVPVALQLKFWGGEWSASSLEILVDGVVIATQPTRTIAPGEWVMKSYPIPPRLSAGKAAVRLELRNAGKGEVRIFLARTVKLVATMD